MSLPEYVPTGFAETIFRDRYAISETETFQQACERVANYIATPEEGAKREEFANRFKDLLLTNRFSPGGRTWRSAGRAKAQLLNCFVCPAEDSREGWGQLLKDVVIISGMGGGVGINFSQIRPRGSKIMGTGGESTGSVSLMKAINGVADIIRAGGNRRAALLFCLRYDHPDIEEFLSVKLDKKELNNANISVIIDNKFIEKVNNDEAIILSWHGQERGKISARKMFNKIIENSLESGDPGLLNFENINGENNIWYIHDIQSVNPCAEATLGAYECCCLGSINLSTHIVNNEIDWEMLGESVYLGVRFLDNVVSINHYPLEQIQYICQKLRRIGLGVMGLHDMLIKLGVKYSSDKAINIIDKVMDFIKRRAYEASIFLSVEKGQFQLLDREKFVQSGFCKKHLTRSLRAKILEHGIRNCTLMALAPTGTISIMAGVSSGIEPIFQPVYKRNFNKHNIKDDEKEKYFEIVVHPLIASLIKENKNLSLVESAHDIPPDRHCKIQAICQRHVDQAISKTINLPKHYKSDELKKIVLKYLPLVKGWTIYRDESKGKSPLVPVSVEEAKQYLSSIKSEASVSECKTGSCSI